MAVISLLLHLACALALVICGEASQYNPDDPQGGGDALGCEATGLERWGTRSLVEARTRANAAGYYVVAMRSDDAACGEPVVVVGEAGWIIAVRGDSGPWNQRCRKGPLLDADVDDMFWRRSLRLGPDCEWNRIIDLSPAAARKVLGKATTGPVVVIRFGTP